MATTIPCSAPTRPFEHVADLLRGVVDGDPAAWNEIVHRYGKLVTSTVRSFRLQDADALDAVQTTWLRLAEHAHQIQEPERLGGWLITTARRICLHILYHNKRAPANLNVVAEAVVTAATDEPEQRVVDAETTRILWNLVSKLSPRPRTVLQALFTDNRLSYAEHSHLPNTQWGNRAYPSTSSQPAPDPARTTSPRPGSLVTRARTTCQTLL